MASLLKFVYNSFQYIRLFISVELFKKVGIYSTGLEEKPNGLLKLTLVLLT